MSIAFIPVVNYLKSFIYPSSENLSYKETMPYLPPTAVIALFATII